MLHFSCPEGMTFPRTVSGPFAYRERPRVSLLKNGRDSLLCANEEGRHNFRLRKRGKAATIFVYTTGECATGPDFERKYLMLDLHSCRFILHADRYHAVRTFRVRMGSTNCDDSPADTKRPTSTDPYDLPRTGGIHMGLLWTFRVRPIGIIAGIWISNTRWTFRVHSTHGRQLGDPHFSGVFLPYPRPSGYGQMDSSRTVARLSEYAIRTLRVFSQDPPRPLYIEARETRVTLETIRSLHETVCDRR